MRLRWLSLAALIVACSSTPKSEVMPTDAGVVSRPHSTTTDLPCEVDAIVGRACQSCHGSTPMFGATMPLDQRVDFLAQSPSEPSKKVWQTVKDRVHRAPDAAGRMPQKPNAPLSANDLATLDKYFADGLPAASCNGTSSDPKQPTVSCKPDVAVRPGTPWSMPKTVRDEYVCYGFDYEVTAKRHVTGILPTVQNPKIVHHILLMQAEDSVSSTPMPCAEFSIARYRMLYAWAPGVGGFELPKEAGLPAETGKTHYVVQIHYNNTQELDGQTDTSGFDLCSTNELRANDADVLAFGSAKFEIPAKSRHDITARWVVPPSIPELHAIGAFPHMHGLGTFIGTTLMPKGGGTAVDLGTDPRFDFNNQFFATLPNVTLKSGDVVETRCVWENPRSEPVTWGENTDDEMCFSFTLYYPKVKVDPWSWGLPSFLSTTEVN